MNWDWHPADAAFFADPPEPVDPSRCCEFKEPAEHQGEKYCVSCGVDLDADNKPLEPTQMFSDEDMFPPGA